jgi:hypothetical protein
MPKTHWCEWPSDYCKSACAPRVIWRYVSVSSAVRLSTSLEASAAASVTCRSRIGRSTIRMRRVCSIVQTRTSAHSCQGVVTGGVTSPPLFARRRTRTLPHARRRHAGGARQPRRRDVTRRNDGARAIRGRLQSCRRPARAAGCDQIRRTAATRDRRPTRGTAPLRARGEIGDEAFHRI